MACGMATGKLWFKVPGAVRFELTGSLGKYVTGKDVILHIIGEIGVDGALYRSMEYTGPGLSSLTVEDRLTMANMAIEAGGKNGIFEVDEATLSFLREHGAKEPSVYKADADAVYDDTYKIDLSQIRPTVAFPHLPENTRTIDQVGDVRIDQVVIGSCTNGLYKDLAEAASIIKGTPCGERRARHSDPGHPGDIHEVPGGGAYKDFYRGWMRGVHTPTCGPCLGGYMGILAAGEKAVSTTNRNFVGRMGHPESEVYLASPYVAAASAIAGKIAGPEEVL